jgi:nitrite reductase (NO-forming)
MTDVRPRLSHSIRYACAALLAVALAGCSSRPDPYDESKMDLKPKPAQLSDTRHTGPFSAGDALSLVPSVGKLGTEPVKTIQLDVVDRVIEIAPGVNFSAWTFGGQVPGPVVHARVGDRIRFSMTNRSDETMPGAPSFMMPMMHSIDFHAAMVSPQDKYRSIAPGQTISFEFQLNYPGVFMYHCGTPMILEHIASGMYGMLIAEPRDGYPTHVDREYAIVQSEFYPRLDPQKRTVQGKPLFVLDAEKVRTKASTYTVFNGVYNGMVDHPLPAKPGERVRLYVLNVGPSNTSSFHVVGTLFDRVWIDGNPDNQFRGMQTVLLPSSGSAIVEFKIPESGKYVMVDHHFANASQGAIGVIDATGGTPELPSEPLEHHNIPATGNPTDPEALQGKMMFDTRCLACHSIGGGPKVGPDLLGVTERRSETWITSWLRSPETMLAKDDTAKALLERFKIPMPNQNLADTDIRRLLTYFRWVGKNPPPAGTDTTSARPTP